MTQNESNGITGNMPLVFRSYGKHILTFTADGSVEFGEGMTKEEAAREFWQFIAGANPLRRQVQHLQAQNNEMQQRIWELEDELNGKHE
jgi:hypothetical protein